MKIVQTFWSGNTTPENYLQNTGGWLSAEYHWMAWALSVLQLRQFYDEVELVTDSVGKTVFQEVLDLPYTAVHAELDALNHYDKRLWALAKIYAYSLQTEPFIHVDGDVFIWKAFESHIEQANLIAQNFEVDFPFYQAPLRTVQQVFEQVPACMLNELEASQHIYSCNTGLIGGHDLKTFKIYKDFAFELIDANLQHLDKVEVQHFNICFEQFLYYALAKARNQEISYVIDRVFDPTYPNYADFHDVPQKAWYIHAMAEYKRKAVVCHHLARRLRKDYPETYYHIIELCLSKGIALDWKCYPLENLNSEWQSFYKKDKIAYAETERVFSQSRVALLATVLVFSPDCEIEEQGEGETYQQTLHYPDITQVAITQQNLDNLNMILLDAFQESISITDAIEAIKPYFGNDDIQQNLLDFEDLVLARIKDFMFLGVLK